ncbi:uncharacterized protein AMSG_01628 [Thecamonas trahens ATCC 50062]|uniref:Uncharacterized protein n=1 Tax=Thecamonas trahens ATCC 50062 TaxID=461836 RepID=A0A0L0DRW9_THETB|nr:hypothetical protein AMSG_01628 [Thecamonas trahens ATCC 50062]KNC54776.1 hypothetical protein AMSG_01628 [Thecamonas trahens ATCC 50062]|eukprot:XP_013761676.1 hypothetical protein AMSG_01628 [Thecamonas trahens ATCC 50062]
MDSVDTAAAAFVAAARSYEEALAGKVKAEHAAAKALDSAWRVVEEPREYSGVCADGTAVTLTAPLRRARSDTRALTKLQSALETRAALLLGPVFAALGELAAAGVRLDSVAAAPPQAEDPAALLAHIADIDAPIAGTRLASTPAAAIARTSELDDALAHCSSRLRAAGLAAAAAIGDTYSVSPLDMLTAVLGLGSRAGWAAALLDVPVDAALASPAWLDALFAHALELGPALPVLLAQYPMAAVAATSRDAIALEAAVVTPLAAGLDTVATSAGISAPVRTLTVALIHRMLALAPCAAPELGLAVLGILTRSPWPSRPLASWALTLFPWQALGADAAAVAFAELYGVTGLPMRAWLGSSASERAEHRTAFAVTCLAAAADAAPLAVAYADALARNHPESVAFVPAHSDGTLAHFPLVAALARLAGSRLRARTPSPPAELDLAATIVDELIGVAFCIEDELVAVSALSQGISPPPTPAAAASLRGEAGAALAELATGSPSGAAVVAERLVETLLFLDGEPGARVATWLNQLPKKAWSGAAAGTSRALLALLSGTLHSVDGDFEDWLPHLIGGSARPGPVPAAAGPLLGGLLDVVDLTSVGARDKVLLLLGFVRAAEVLDARWVWQTVTSPSVVGALASGPLDPTYVQIVVSLPSHDAGPLLRWVQLHLAIGLAASAPDLAPWSWLKSEVRAIHAAASFATTDLEHVSGVSLAIGLWHALASAATSAWLEIGRDLAWAMAAILTAHPEALDTFSQLVAASCGYQQKHADWLALWTAVLSLQLASPSVAKLFDLLIYSAFANQEELMPLVTVLHHRKLDAAAIDTLLASSLYWVVYVVLLGESPRLPAGAQAPVGTSAMYRFAVVAKRIPDEVLALPFWEQFWTMYFEWTAALPPGIAIADKKKLDKLQAHFVERAHAFDVEDLQALRSGATTLSKALSKTYFAFTTWSDEVVPGRGLLFSDPSLGLLDALRERSPPRLYVFPLAVANPFAPEFAASRDANAGLDTASHGAPNACRDLAVPSPVQLVVATELSSLQASQSIVDLTAALGSLFDTYARLAAEVDDLSVELLDLASGMYVERSHRKTGEVGCGPSCTGAARIGYAVIDVEYAPANVRELISVNASHFRSAVKRLGQLPQALAETLVALERSLATRETAAPGTEVADAFLSLASVFVALPLRAGLLGMAPQLAAVLRDLARLAHASVTAAELLPRLATILASSPAVKDPTVRSVLYAYFSPWQAAAPSGSLTDAGLELYWSVLAHLEKGLSSATALESSEQALLADALQLDAFARQVLAGLQGASPTERVAGAGRLARALAPLVVVPRLAASVNGVLGLLMGDQLLEVALEAASAALQAAASSPEWQPPREMLRSLPVERLDQGPLITLLESMAAALPVADEPLMAFVLPLLRRCVLDNPHALVLLHEATIAEVAESASAGGGFVDGLLGMGGDDGDGSDDGSDESDGSGVAVPAAHTLWDALCKVCWAALKPRVEFGTGRRTRVEYLSTVGFDGVLRLVADVAALCPAVIDKMVGLVACVFGPYVSASRERAAAAEVLESGVAALPWAAATFHLCDSRALRLLYSLTESQPWLVVTLFSTLDWSAYAAGDDRCGASAKVHFLRLLLELRVCGHAPDAVDRVWEELGGGEAADAQDAAERSWAGLETKTFATCFTGTTLVRGLVVPSLAALHRDEPSSRLLDAARLLSRAGLANAGAGEVLLGVVRELRALVGFSVTFVRDEYEYEDESVLGGGALGGAIDAWHLSAKAHASLVSHVMVPVVFASEAVPGHAAQCLMQLVECAAGRPADAVVVDVAAPGFGNTRDGLDARSQVARHKREAIFAALVRSVTMACSALPPVLALEALNTIPLVGLKQLEAARLLEEALRALFSATEGKLASAAASLMVDSDALNVLALACAREALPLLLVVVMAKVEGAARESRSWAETAVSLVALASRYTVNPSSPRAFEVIIVWLYALRVIGSANWDATSGESQAAVAALRAELVRCEERLTESRASGLFSMLRGKAGSSSESGSGSAMSPVVRLAAALARIWLDLRADRAAGAKVRRAAEARMGALEVLASTPQWASYASVLMDVAMMSSPLTGFCDMYRWLVEALVPYARYLLGIFVTNEAGGLHEDTDDAEYFDTAPPEIQLAPLVSLDDADGADEEVGAEQDRGGREETAVVPLIPGIAPPPARRATPGARSTSATSSPAPTSLASPVSTKPLIILD